MKTTKSMYMQRFVCFILTIVLVTLMAFSQDSKVNLDHEELQEVK